MKLALFILSILFILSSCQKTTTKEVELTGTTWEIWQYRDATSTNPIPLNDTLIFSNDCEYSYNGYQQHYLLNESGSEKDSLCMERFSVIFLEIYHVTLLPTEK